MKTRVICLFSLILLISACTSPQATVPLEKAASAPSDSASLVPPIEAGPGESAGAYTTQEAGPFSTPVMAVEPTLPPTLDDEETAVSDLPLGQPGRYVNVAFGYWVEYPADWHATFGSRPRSVTFSNLDPRTYNRQSLRLEGCFLEINASPNIYGYTPEALRAQMPRSFPNSEAFDLAGERGLRVRKEMASELFESEWVYVTHGDRLFVITFERGQNADDSYRLEWERLLAMWHWFEPSMAVYSNTDFGYSVSYPRQWHRFNTTERGISISELGPENDVIDASFVSTSMVVTTDVYENPDSLPIRDWISEEVHDVLTTNDVPLDNLTGVRVVRTGPSPGIQQMVGYFEGPLGRIYAVTCLYAAELQWTYRPIANAIIYSFTF